MIEYGPASRLLHRLALGNYAVARLSLKIGRSRLRKARRNDRAKKVFVTGLARSGTTALTRHLASVQGFCTGTYQDMPFPLMPNVWRPINRHEGPALRERHHGDGLLIDYSSVEAFEEFFWKTAADDSYVREQSLALDRLDETKLSLFLDYIACVLDTIKEDTQAVYLSKNNNQVLRIRELHRRLSESWFIILLRNPLDHALSLLNQHRRFCVLQERDDFVLSYMDWLGHHEFGLNAKWFDLGNRRLNEWMAQWSRERVDHWLAGWLNYYSYILEWNPAERVFLVGFDRLCQAPNEVLSALGERIGFKSNRSIDPFHPRHHEATSDAHTELLAECDAVYADLRSLSL